MAEETRTAIEVGAMPIIEALGATLASAPVSIEQHSAPSLDEAFHTLCRALYPLLADDMPAQMHSNDIRAIYADGNHFVAWRHAILLLEQVLGQKVTPA